MDRRRALLTILASTEESVDTYSSAMRELNKDDSEKIKLFMGKFKDVFDDALEQGLDNHQDEALVEAKKTLAQDSMSRFVKLAQVVLEIKIILARTL